MIFNIFEVVFILICYIFTVIIIERFFTLVLDKGYVKWYGKRVSKLFVQRKYTISQHHSLLARKELRNFRKGNKYKPFHIKLRKAGYILNRELMNLITGDTLEKNKIYTADTHLIGRLKKAERLGYIEIIETVFKKERLLVEAIAFLSLREIIQNKSHLKRKFFEVRFSIK